MAKHNHRELARMEGWLRRQGSPLPLIVRRTKNQHLRVINPNIEPGEGVRTSAMWSSASGDGRSLANSRAEFKAIGIEIPVSL